MKLARRLLEVNAHGRTVAESPPRFGPGWLCKSRLKAACLGLTPPGSQQVAFFISPLLHRRPQELRQLAWSIGLPRHHKKNGACTHVYWKPGCRYICMKTIIYCMLVVFSWVLSHWFHPGQWSATRWYLAVFLGWKRWHTGCFDRNHTVERVAKITPPVFPPVWL